MSRRIYAGEDAVNESDGGARGGNIRAGLGERDEQGNLPDESAFARHVGAGDDEDLVVAVVEARIVGNETFLDQGLFENRMASVGNINDVAIVDGRAAIILVARQLGETGKGVELGERNGGLLDGEGLFLDLDAELLEQLEFKRIGFFVGAENLAFHFLQLRRVETFAGGDGLFANIIDGDFGEVGLGDLDVVTEHGIVADFERGDAGALDFFLLERGDPTFAVGGGAAKFVQLGAVAGLDETAVLRRERRRVLDSARDEVGEVGLLSEFGSEFGEDADGGGQMLFQFRQRGEGFLEGNEVAGVAAAGAETREEALHVADGAELFAKIGEHVRLVAERRDNALTRVDGGDVFERMRDPLAKQARAHRCERAVHASDECVAAVAARAVKEFEVALRDGIWFDGSAIEGFARIWRARQRSL